MEILDALDEIRMRNARNERVDANSAIDKLVMSSKEAQDRLKKMQEEEDEALAKSIFQNADGEYVKRVDDDPREALRRDLLAKHGPIVSSSSSSTQIFHSSGHSSRSSLFAEKRKDPPPTSTSSMTAETLGIIKKQKTNSQTPPINKNIPPQASKASALSLLGDVYSDSD